MYILGIDTGGTYTDAVLVDAATKKIISKAKALTTKNDLKGGIEAAIGKLEIECTSSVKGICLSTTLATNAVIERKACNTGLIITGAELKGPTPAQYVEWIPGKMNIKGVEQEPISEHELKAAIGRLEGRVESIAVSGYASVRNPEHEIKIKEMVKNLTNIPVFCAHELSGSLGFLKRTNTAVLNAGLIGIIREFLDATKQILTQKNIKGQLMVVKSDGSLMNAESAMQRPIETILSGPAASIIGATMLTDIKDALILDMGGTTIDIANSHKGQIRLNKNGARVADWETKVHSVEVSTHGIGGDSWIQAEQGQVKVGPKKAEPISRISTMYPEYLLEMEKIEKTEMPVAEKAKYSIGYIYVGKEDGKCRTPHTYWYWEKHMGQTGSLDEMNVIDVTPTDLLYLAGKPKSEAANAINLRIGFLALQLGTKKKALLIRMQEAIQKTIYAACLQSTADFAGRSIDLKKETAAAYLLDKMFYNRDKEFLSAKAILTKPVVAVGAPAGAWIPVIGEYFCTEVIIPEHAEVANAFGASCGMIRERVEGLIRREKKKRKYYLYLPNGKKVFYSRKSAFEFGAEELKRHVLQQAEAAGCSQAEVTVKHTDVYVDLPGKHKVYVETKMIAEATGYPQFEG